MGWEILIPLIINNGLPLALKLYEKWGSKDAVTLAEIEELKRLGAQTPQTQMRDALTRVGIPADDPKAKALLALVGA